MLQNVQFAVIFTKNSISSRKHADELYYADGIGKGVDIYTVYSIILM